MSGRKEALELLEQAEKTLIPETAEDAEALKFIRDAAHRLRSQLAADSLDLGSSR